MNSVNRPLCGITLLLLSSITSAAHGEHVAIDLQVIGSQDRQEAFADREPPPGGVNPRPRLTVNAGEPLVLQAILTNVYPHGVRKDVTMRYYVVRTGAFGETQVPPPEAAVTQGSATLNFKPKARVGVRLKMRINEPGIYMVRVDTLNTDSDHEHFSAIDLEVK